jgi:hypothetical protein
VQCVVCSVQSAVCSVQCVVCSPEQHVHCGAVCAAAGPVRIGPAGPGGEVAPGLGPGLAHTEGPQGVQRQALLGGRGQVRRIGFFVVA